MIRRYYNDVDITITIRAEKRVLDRVIRFLAYKGFNYKGYKITDYSYSEERFKIYSYHNLTLKVRKHVWK